MIPRTSDGFTFVELTVTIVLIGVIFLGLFNVFTGIQQAQTQTNYLETATREAQREVEALRNSNYNNLTAGQNINFTSSLPTTLPHGSTGTVIVSEPSNGIKRVDVTVTYTYAGKTRDVSLSSLIGVIGIAQ